MHEVTAGMHELTAGMHELTAGMHELTAGNLSSSIHIHIYYYIPVLIVLYTKWVAWQ